MIHKTCICILIAAVLGMVMLSCQSEGLILEKKNMQFVGQFNKGFSYEILGFGPLLQKVAFSKDDLLALAQEEIPEAATLEDIFVVDVGFVVNPDDQHAADFIDIKISEDSSYLTDIISIEDLFVDGELIIDPAELNLGDDYDEMLQNLNELIQSGGINEYVLDLILDSQDTNAMTDLDVDVVFSFKFSFRTCIDVPAGTEAKDCE